MNNYIIAIDEKGQPFIAHAGDRMSHKYFRKIQKGNRIRYFYSEKEWNAYVKNMNRPKSQTELQTERKAAEKQLNEANSLVRQGENALNLVQKRRKQNSDLLKRYEKEYKEKKDRLSKDPDYQWKQVDKWTLEGGIQDLRETDKEWANLEDTAKTLRNAAKHYQSYALRELNAR